MDRKRRCDTLLDEELQKELEETGSLQLAPWSFEEAQRRPPSIEMVQVVEEDGEEETQVIPQEFTRPKYRH